MSSACCIINLIIVWHILSRMFTIILTNVPSKSSFVPSACTFSNVCGLNTFQALLRFHQIFVEPACLIFLDAYLAFGISIFLWLKPAGLILYVYLALISVYFDLQQLIIEESGSAIAQLTLGISQQPQFDNFQIFLIWNLQNSFFFFIYRYYLGDAWNLKLRLLCLFIHWSSHCLVEVEGKPSHDEKNLDALIYAKFSSPSSSYATL